MCHHRHRPGDTHGDGDEDLRCVRCEPDGRQQWTDMSQHERGEGGHLSQSGHQRLGSNSFQVKMNRISQSLFQLMMPGHTECHTSSHLSESRTKASKWAISIKVVPLGIITNISED